MAKKKITVKRVGVGRNDLCPCGSGKKYKKCCKPIPRMMTDEERQDFNEKRRKHTNINIDEFSVFVQSAFMMNRRKRLLNESNEPGRVSTDGRN